MPGLYISYNILFEETMKMQIRINGRKKISFWISKGLPSRLSLNEKELSFVFILNILRTVVFKYFNL